MNEFTTKTIKEIALEMPLTTRVFEEYKIDFCCGGNVPFGEACRKAGVEPLTVLLKIDQIATSGKGGPADAPERKSARELIQHIVNHHHEFTRKEIERLIPLMEKVCRKHGEHHPALFAIQPLFAELADELLPHMRKEEMVLFPYIEQLQVASERDATVARPHFGTVNNPIRMMMFEHDRAGDLLKQIRTLSENYSVPDWACPSFRGLFAGLEDLERDLHQHIHLENNILFPSALNMEELTLSGTSLPAGSAVCSGALFR